MTVWVQKNLPTLSFIMTIETRIIFEAIKRIGSHPSYRNPFESRTRRNVCRAFCCANLK